jgi:hypothetical protein
MSKLHEEKGLLKPSSGGNGILIGDPKEVINWEFSCNHQAASAPITDGVYARGNIYQLEEMGRFYVGFHPASGGNHSILNDFVHAGCEEALALADGLINKIEKERVLSEIVSNYKK